MFKLRIMAVVLGLLLFLSCGQKEMRFRFENGGGGESQTEIQGPDGRRVFIDVISSSFSDAPFKEDDVLIVTHGHPDHRSAGVINHFPGEMILFEKAERKWKGLEIVVIPAAHNEGDEIREIGSTDHLVLVKTGGMTFLHTGDCGQEAFTQDQLNLIGEVDVYIGQFIDSYSGNDREKRLGFKLVDQLQPKIVIPNHYTDGALDYAAVHYPMAFNPEDWTMVTPGNLPDEPTFLFTGRNASEYGDLYELPAWDNF